MVETAVVANEYRGERGRHMPPSSKPQNGRGRPLNSFYDQSPFESRDSSKTQKAKPDIMMSPTPDLVKGTVYSVNRPISNTFLSSLNQELVQLRSRIDCLCFLKIPLQGLNKFEVNIKPKLVADRLNIPVIIREVLCPSVPSKRRQLRLSATTPRAWRPMLPSHYPVVKTSGKLKMDNRLCLFRFRFHRLLKCERTVRKRRKLPICM